MSSSESWDCRCAVSMEKEKAQIAKRYNIRFGQTEICCVRCGSPVLNPLRHTCSDLRLKALQEEKRHQREKEKIRVEDSVRLIRELGRTKVATMLELDVKTVNNWIDRRKIPVRYQGKVFEVCQTCRAEGDVCI